jgi:hypothetical protein
LITITVHVEIKGNVRGNFDRIFIMIKLEKSQGRRGGD